MNFFKKAILLTLLFALTGCASPVIKLENPNTPFERPGYTMYSPPEDGWLFIEFDNTGNHVLAFNKPQEERDHTLYASVEEVYANATFQTPEEFLKFYETAKQMGSDPRRFEIIEEEIKLDNRFGEFSVSHYSKVEDHAAQQRTNTPFLMMESYAYSIIHPKLENKVINITYSERAISGDVDANFKENAMKFINGFKIKQ